MNANDPQGRVGCNGAERDCAGPTSPSGLDPSRSALRLIATAAARDLTPFDAAAQQRALHGAGRRGAALKLRRRTLPGEGFAQELDAKVAGDEQSVGVRQLQRRAESLLVLRIVDPARFPGGAGPLLQVAQHLGAADALAGSRLVVRVLEPDHASAHAIAARDDLHRSLAGVVDPHPRHIGRGALRGGSDRQQEDTQDRAQGEPGRASRFKLIHARASSMRELRPGATTCNPDAEKMRQRRKRPPGGGAASPGRLNPRVRISASGNRYLYKDNESYQGGCEMQAASVARRRAPAVLSRPGAALCPRRHLSRWS